MVTRPDRQSPGRVPKWAAGERQVRDEASRSPPPVPVAPGRPLARALWRSNRAGKGVGAPDALRALERLLARRLSLASASRKAPVAHPPLTAGRRKARTHLDPAQPCRVALV